MRRFQLLHLLLAGFIASCLIFQGCGHEVKTPKTTDQNCPMCKGSGRLTGPCAICNGTGTRVSGVASPITCTSCGGTGAVSMLCPACAGTGKVLNMK